MAPSNAPEKVVGLAASAGGIGALSAVVAGLPPRFPAAVLIVLHIAPTGTSVLPDILSRAGALPARHAVDGEPLAAGTVLVAPPDRHLVVEDGHIRLTLGPRENRHRPAADPLFRSIAEAFGPNSAAVVLSGTLDDGAAGLLAVKNAGGLTIAQDPEEAAFPGMPANAIRYAHPDHVTELRKIPDLLLDFAAAAAVTWHPSRPHPDPHADEAELSEFTCPECGGNLWASDDDGFRFRCRVGHSFSASALSVEKLGAVEAALWAAIVAMEERIDLSRRLLRRLSPSTAESHRRLEESIDASQEQIHTLRALLGRLADEPGDLTEPAGA